MAKIIEKIIQSKYPPNSTDVLWDDGENLKIARNGNFENVMSTMESTNNLNIEVTVDNTTGTPSANATVEEGTIKLAFSGLKGETGPQGNSGYQGAAGELEVVNNLIDGGESAALSAEQGRVLKEELTELSEEINGELTGYAKLLYDDAVIWNTAAPGIKAIFECGDIAGKPIRIDIGFTGTPPSPTIQCYFANSRWSDGIITTHTINVNGTTELVAPAGTTYIWLFSNTVASSALEGHAKVGVSAGKTGLQEHMAEIQTRIGVIEEDMVNINGDLGGETRISENNRIRLYIDNTPAVDNYLMRVVCANPLQTAFNIYKATPSHGDLELIKTGITYGQWVALERDSQKPVLYLYESATADGISEMRTYHIEFKAASSLARDVENLQESVGWDGKTIVCFGDSITEFRDTLNNKSYADYLSELSSAQVFNLGIGGTQFRQRTTPVASPTSANEAYAALDIVSIVKACCEQDFSKQEAACNYLNATNAGDNNLPIIERAKLVDWAKVDAVTIFGGTNDWNNASGMWGAEDSTNITTTYGAINEIVRMLMTTYPHVKIYWFTPIVRWVASSLAERTDENWSDNIKRGTSTLKEFSASVEDIVKRHHLPVCDMYNTLGWNKYNFAHYFLDTDGVHPYKGMHVLAKKIFAFINANRTF